ncbi:hypothetical protein D3C73_1212690 [compost metagenome]
MAYARDCRTGHRARRDHAAGVSERGQRHGAGGAAEQRGDEGDVDRGVAHGSRQERHGAREQQHRGCRHDRRGGCDHGAQDENRGDHEEQREQKRVMLRAVGRADLRGRLGTGSGLGAIEQPDHAAVAGADRHLAVEIDGRPGSRDADVAPQIDAAHREQLRHGRISGDDQIVPPVCVGHSEANRLR